LFIGETVRAALEDGTLAWRDGRVALVESAEATMPVTLRAVLGARIDALDATEQEVLRVASVIGMTFGQGLLGELHASAIEPATLQRLTDAALIERADDGAWRFAHPLIRDAAYRGLLAARRRTLHARLADELEGRPGAALGEVATHRAAAGDAARALPLLREAADSAMRLGAAAEAAAFWRQAAALSSADAPADSAIDQARADEALAAARALAGPIGLDLA
jgi:adenylate cyclase